MSVPTRRRSRLGPVLVAMVALLVTLLPAPGARAATTWLVGPSDTSAVDFTLVQDAIDAATDGDVVEVLPGEYAELLDFGGKAITVRSTNGPEETTINGHGDGAVVTFDDGEGRDSVLAGLTIRGGLAWSTAGYDGGGVDIEDSSPTIRDNVITDNGACSGGAGIGVHFGSPVIVDNVITDNSRESCTGGSGGGGIRVGGDDGATTVIEGNVIRGNRMPGGGSGGGIDLFAAGDVLVRDNLVADNWADHAGGAIRIVNGTRATIVQNLVTGNSAGDEGGGIAWLVPQSTSPLPSVVVGNTIADNTAPDGAALHLDGAQDQVDWVDNAITSANGPAVRCGDGYNVDGVPGMRHNLVWAAGGDPWAGTCPAPDPASGNVSDAPRFLDGFRPGPGSPLVDAGEFRPELPTGDFGGHARVVDGDGDGTATVDIGAYEAAAETWEVPTAPTGVTATLAGPDLWIDWAPPEPAGTLPLVAYEVEVGDEVWSVEPNRTWLDLDADDVAGDTEVAVRAVNAVGPGPWATAAIVEVATAPSEPTNLAVTRTDDGIDVAWDLPADDGGAPITGWIVTWEYDDVFPGVVQEVPLATRSLSVPARPDQGLFLTVAAVNEVGWGTEAVVEVPAVATAPGPVVELVANLWQDVVTVAWEPPTDDGGTPVTTYDVAYAGGTTTVDAATTLVELPWVPTADAVTVTASNEVGTGDAATATVRDRAEPPSAPTAVTAVGGVGRVVVSWEPPESDGGAPLDDYLVEVGTGTGATVAADVHEFVVDGLAPGAAVTVTVRARNRAGTSSGASATATTIDVPSAPRNLVATTQRRDELALSWDPPADDGGNQLAGYRVTEVRSGQTRLVPATSTSLVLSGVDKQSWEVEVVAYNDAGTGPAATVAGGGDGGDGGSPPNCHPRKGC